MQIGAGRISPGVHRAGLEPDTALPPVSPGDGSIDSVAERLEALPHELCREKGWRLPFTSPFKPISKQEAARHLSEHDERLFVKVNDRELPLRDTGDLEELEIFQGLRPPRDQLSALLAETQVQDVSAYEAYNRLTGGWDGAVDTQSCLIADHNLPVGWLTADRVQGEKFYQAVEENRRKAAGAQSRADKLDYLNDFYRNRSDAVVPALEKLGDAELVAAYQSLSQSHPSPAQTIRSLEEQWPDQLVDRARALGALSQPSPELEKAMHGAFAAQLAQGVEPHQAAESLYALIHRRRDQAAILAAATRHPERIEKLTWLLEQGQEVEPAGRLLEAVGGRAGHLEALQRIGAFDRGYDQPGYRSGAAEAFHQALDARVAAGAGLEEAEADCKRLWKALAANRRTDRVQEGCTVLAGEAAARADVRESFFGLLEDGFHPAQAGQFALLLAEPVGSTTQAQRREAFRALGLIGGGEPLNSYDVKEQVYNLYRQSQDVEPLKRLGEVLSKRRGSQDDAHLAFRHLGQAPEALDSLCRLLDSGVPVKPAVEALTAAEDPAAAALALAPLGQHAREDAARAVIEALQGHPAEAANLKGLMEAAPREGATLAVYFKDHLVGRPEAARRLATLLTHRLDVQRSTKLLEALEASADPDGQVKALERLGAFNTDYDQPGYYKAPEPFQAALAGSGLPLPQAEAACSRIWKALVRTDRERSLSEALDGLVALRGFERECYLELLDGSFHAGRARSFAEKIADGSQLETFKSLGLVNSQDPLNYYTVKEAAWEAYRAHGDREGLAELGKGLASASEEQAAAAFASYPAGAEERRDYRRMTAAGVPAQIARETVDEKGSPELLVGLSGWRALSSDTAAAFRRGPANLENLAPVIKRRQIQAEDAVKLAGYCHVSLADRSEERGVLARLVDLGLPADQAIGMFESLDQPLPGTTITQRLEALEGLSAFDRSYDAPGYRDAEAPQRFYSAVSGLVKNGLSLKEATATTSRMWKALAKNDRTRGLPEACAFLSQAADPLRREQFLTFLERQFHADAATRLENLLAEPAPGREYAQRCHDFQELGLIGAGAPLNYYDVKAAAYRAYRSELEAGVPPEPARQRVTRLGQVLTELGASQETAEQAIAFASSQLRNEARGWATFAGLLESKLPLALVTAAVQRGGTGDLVGALAGLGRHREPTDAMVAAFQGVASVSGAGDLAAAVGRNRLPEQACIEAADYLRTHLANEPDQRAALVKLLDYRLAFQEARELLEALAPPLADTTIEERFNVLESAGAFSWSYGHPPDPKAVYAGIAGQVRGGLSLKKALKNCKKLAALLQDAGRTGQADAAYAHLGAMAGDAARQEHYLALLNSSFHPGPAAALETLVSQEAGQTTYAQRVADFDGIGLVKSRDPVSAYVVKEGLFRVYRQLLTEGSDRETAVKAAKRLNERLTELRPKAEEAADFLDLYRLDPAGAERALLLQEGKSFRDSLELLRQAQALKQGPGFIAMEQDRVVIDGMELEVRTD